MPQTEQYVLVTEEGDERTSHVTDGRISEAIGEIEANVYVVLEKCRPLAVSEKTAVFAMSYDKDSLFAVHVERNNGELFRLALYDCSPDEAVAMMCAFLDRQELPDMSEWWFQQQAADDEQQDEDMKLVVDNEEFRHFDLSDVLVALQNIRAGKSKWIQLYYYGGSMADHGCMEAARDESAPGFACKVDWYRGVDSSAVGYRTVTSDFGRLQQWFTDRMVLGISPTPDEGWTAYNVEEYFKELVNRVLEDKDDEGTV